MALVKHFEGTRPQRFGEGGVDEIGLYSSRIQITLEEGDNLRGVASFLQLDVDRLYQQNRAELGDNLNYSTPLQPGVILQYQSKPKGPMYGII